MARIDANPAQLALVSDEPSRKRGRRKTGRHERAFDRVVKAKGWESDHVMDAAVSLGRALASGLDRAELSNANGYELSQLGKDYREHLRALGVLPVVSAAAAAVAAEPLDFGGPEPD